LRQPGSVKQRPKQEIDQAIAPMMEAPVPEVGISSKPGLWTAWQDA